MWSTIRGPLRRLCAPLVRHCGYAGGCPGNNLPFRKGLDSPMRFTFFWLVLGTLGFGAPWLVVRHQMLRNTGEAPKEEPVEEPVEEETGKDKKDKGKDKKDKGKDKKDDKNPEAKDKDAKEEKDKKK